MAALARKSDYSALPATATTTYKYIEHCHDPHIYLLPIRFQIIVLYPDYLQADNRKRAAPLLQEQT